MVDNHTQKRSKVLPSAFAALMISVAPLTLSAVDSLAQTEEAQNYYEDALKEIEEGNLSEAAIQLRNALQSSPEFYKARLELAKTYHELGDMLAAEKEAEIAHENMLSDDTEVAYGEILLGLGKFQEALETVIEDAKTEEAKRNKYTIRGFAFAGLQRVDRAHEMFDAALQIDPTDQRAFYGKATVLALEGKNTEAHEILVRLTEEDDEFVLAWTLRADSALAIGENEDAIMSMNKAIKLAPNSAETLITRARVNLAAGEMDIARADVDKATQIAPNNGVAHYVRAAVAYAQGDIEEADISFTVAEALVAEYQPLSLLGALIKYDKGDLAYADRLLSVYLSKSPDDIRAQRVLASVRLRTGQPQSAIKLLERVIRKNQSDINSMEYLAAAYVAADRFTEAEEMYRQIIQIGPLRSARQAYASLQLLGAEKDEDPAEGLDSFPQNIGRSVLKILNLLSSNNIEDAEKESDRLMAYAPDNPIVINMKGGVELAKKRFVAAREYFELALEKQPEFIAAIDNLDHLDYLEQRPEMVEARLRKLVKDNPDSPALAIRMGSYLVENGQVVEAEKFLAKKLKELPQSYTLANALTRTYFIGNKPEKAGEVAKWITENYEGDNDALVFAANAMRDAGDLDGALATAERILAENDEVGTAYVMAAQGHVYKDDYDSAIKIMSTGIKKLPQDRVVARGLIELLLFKERYDLAKSVADKFRQKDPGGGAILQAEIYSSKGDHDKAINEIDLAMVSNPNTELALNLFQARKLAGKDEEAREGLHSWIKSNTNDAAALVVYATELLTIDDKIGAEDIFQQYLAVRPNDPLALNNYAWVRHELGRPDAIEYAARAYQLSAGTPEIADTFGWILVHEGQLNDGLQVLRSAAGRAPNNGDIAYHLAYALNEAGAKDEAKKVLTKALDQAGEFDSRDEAKELLGRL